MAIYDDDMEVWDDDDSHIGTYLVEVTGTLPNSQSAMVSFRLTIGNYCIDGSLVNVPPAPSSTFRYDIRSGIPLDLFPLDWQFSNVDCTDPITYEI